MAGSGCYLYASSGSSFLDCVNNVAHVGHSHPHVTQRIADQQRIINTNSVTQRHERFDAHAARFRTGAGRDRRSYMTLRCAD